LAGGIKKEVRTRSGSEGFLLLAQKAQTAHLQVRATDLNSPLLRRILLAQKALAGGAAALFVALLK
jgi:hypothetical protein